MNKKSVNKRKRRVTRRHVANSQKGGTFGLVRETTYHSLKQSYDKLQDDYNGLKAKLNICEKKEIERLTMTAQLASTHDNSSPHPPPLKSTTVKIDFKFITKINKFTKMKIDTSTEPSLSSVMNYDHNLKLSKPATSIQKNIYAAFKEKFNEFGQNTIFTVIDQDCNIVGFVKNPYSNSDNLELLFFDVNSEMYILLFEMKQDSVLSHHDDNFAFNRYFTSSLDRETISVDHFKELK